MGFPQYKRPPIFTPTFVFSQPHPDHTHPPSRQRSQDNRKRKRRESRRETPSMRQPRRRHGNALNTGGATDWRRTQRRGVALFIPRRVGVGGDSNLGTGMELTARIYLPPGSSSPPLVGVSNMGHTVTLIIAAWSLLTYRPASGRYMEYIYKGVLTPSVRPRRKPPRHCLSPPPPHGLPPDHPGPVSIWPWDTCNYLLGLYLCVMF